MLNIKKLVYEQVAATGLTIKDNPNGGSYGVVPYGLVRTINQAPINFKNFKKNYWLLRVDIFSAYKGEKEIMDLFESIKTNVNSLLTANQEITYINLSLEIIDDKEQGPINKHGIVTIDIKTMEV